MTIDSLQPAPARFAAPIRRMLQPFSKLRQLGLFVDRFIEKFSKRFLQLRGTSGFQPLPSVGAPITRLAVAAVLDKGEKFLISHRRARNTESSQFDGMRPFLVIKDERKLRRGPDEKTAHGNFC